MGSLRTFTAALAAPLSLGLLAAGAEPHVARSAQQVLVLGSRNHTPALRPLRTIDRIVIHVTEGRFRGSVRWLRNPRSRGSSHFVVSRSGRIVQLVSTSDIAWHAGNRRVNARSLGIEHEGWTYRRGSITGAEYRASARLVAYLASRMGIPIDRRHVIGHAEVRHPSGRGWGGAGHHTDPGPYWDWDRYLRLVRRYAREPQRPRFLRVTPLHPLLAVRRTLAHVRPTERAVRCGFRPSVHSTTLYAGQSLAGLVPWKAKTCGRRLLRVDFFVDGRLRWVDRKAPFAFARGRGWNSTSVANGWHTLSLRAYGPNGHRVRRRLRVRVDNRLFTVRAAGVTHGQAVSGTLRVRGRVNVAAERVALFVDGRFVARDTRPPFRFEWDTTTAANGPHTLELWSEARDGRRATRTIPFLVANADPEPGPPPQLVWQSLVDWQTVDAGTRWEALVEGSVAQVEFWVDGRLRLADREPSYALEPVVAGDVPGPHRLRLRVVGADGRTVEQERLVLVALDPSS
ncbi:MAG TPA: N-acetylmuramoyl-L-alanine amidase [Gaiellaceae bacterium]|nr:N-acetylmuramoyl-L-alanine amidase [Gaiellaceae bacterium]